MSVALYVPKIIERLSTLHGSERGRGRRTITPSSTMTIPLEQRVAQMEVDLAIQKTEVIEVLRKLEEEKVGFGDMVSVQLAASANAVQTVIADARREFARVDETFQNLYGRTKVAVEQIESRLAALESRSSGGAGKGNSGYLPM